MLKIDVIWDTLKEGEIEELSPLIIFGLIPFDDCVLKLTDTVQVTVDLLRTVDEEKTLRPIFIVGERRNLRSL